jgi:hypothetical protein
MLCTEKSAMQAITRGVEDYVPHFHGHSISGLELHQFYTSRFLLPHWAVHVCVLFGSSYVLSLFLECCLRSMDGGTVVTQPRNFLNNAPRDVICQFNFRTCFHPGGSPPWLGVPERSPIPP